MKRSFRPVHVALIALLCAQATHAVPVWNLVNGVTEAGYTSHLRDNLYTHTGDNRDASPIGADHNAARDYILSVFGGLGLDAYIETSSHGGYTCQNVVGVHTGLVNPENIWILGAHYDSVGNPGADDNASGVAGVLEAAESLATYPFGDTIIFIAFDQEETGLHGSAAWARDHDTENILGMVNMDMIAYNPASPPSGVQTDRVSLFSGDQRFYEQIKWDLMASIDEYSGGLTTIDRGGLAYSDHESFEDEGFPSVLIIEDAMGTFPTSNNPYYHTQSDSVDTIGYIDYAYATKITRGAVGFLASNANDTPEPGTLVLTGSGLVAIVLVARRRRRRDDALQDAA